MTAPAVSALLALAAAILPACVIVVDAESEPAPRAKKPATAAPLLDPSLETDSATSWPARWPGDESGPRGVVVELDGPLSAWHPVRLGEHHYLRTAQQEYDDASTLAAMLGQDEGFKFRPEGPGSYIFVTDARYLGPDAEPMPDHKPIDPQLMIKFLSGRASEKWGGVEGVDIQRTWLAFYDPSGRPPEDTRGTIVLLPGMFGTPEPVIEGVIADMRRRGWSVLRMLSHPSRFTQRMEFDINIANLESSADALADELGDRAAEVAYATHAGVKYAREQRPALEGRPTVLMGMSGGAIALPAVHAWKPDLYDAAILIAGGVNYLEINQRSNYADWIEAFDITWSDGGEPLDEAPPGDKSRLSRVYLRRAPLDGYHLAGELQGKPILVIHGSRDRAVPADLGNLLWERLGRPERWVMPVGHELLFLALPTQTGRMDRWLAEQLESDTPSETGP